MSSLVHDGEIWKVTISAQLLWTTSVSLHQRDQQLLFVTLWKTHDACKHTQAQSFLVKNKHMEILALKLSYLLLHLKIFPKEK